MYVQRKMVFLLLGAGLLAGCQSIKITQPPVQAHIQPNFNMERKAGEEKVVVRTYVKDEKNKQKEVAGANCNLSSVDFTASVITPGEVIVPRFAQKAKFDQRGRPGHLRIECRLNDKMGIQTFTARQKEVHTATGAGIAGAIITTVVTAAIASATPWVFGPTLGVDLDQSIQPQPAVPPLQPPQSPLANTDDRSLSPDDLRMRTQE